MLTETRWTVVARWHRASRSTSSSSAWTIEYSCMSERAEARLPLVEKRCEALPELGSIGAARELLEFPIEVIVQPVHPGGEVDQPLGDTVGARRSRRDPGSKFVDACVELGLADDLRDQSK